MIGIIGTNRAEIDGIKACLTESFSQKISGIEFTRGLLHGSSVVVAASGKGKVNCSVCAEIIVLRYSPDYIINVGVGTALDNEPGAGKIAVADIIMNNDIDVSGDEFVCSEKLADFICRSAKIHKIGVKRGSVVTADKVVDSPEQKAELKKVYGDAILAETDGSALAQICEMNKVPFAVLRSAVQNPRDVADAVFSRNAENYVKILEGLLRFVD